MTSSPTRLRAEDATRFSRVLVTGGTGFLGRPLVEALVPIAGQIVVAARSSALVPSGVRSSVTDLAREGASTSLVQETRPDTVFHLAGRRPASAGEPASATLGLNTLAAVELMTVCADLGVSRLVLVGTADEYGDQAVPVSEDAPLRPITIYGASKAAASLHALALHRSHGLPVVIVRPFSVYGPGAPASMFLAEAVDCAVRGEPFRMTHGTQRRDFVFVDDVVRGVLAAASAERAVGRAFNLGSGESHRLRDVAERLWAISGTRALLLVGARPAPAGDLLETRADTTAATRILAWSASVSVDEGLARTLAAHRARLESPCR